ncbi:MBL fold metallo-hydrolase [Corynebacterium epidermidicanis]|uniref:Zn-dependent hydrolase, glyoxylase n=1 Tax=Corynebacterium epidermidicanis TaxID=1050174 RepID=A0A0G3GPY5_9CORY|nr:MBL fold metallo-hydrolase [Corynebacterium epidermidicanis]AKK03266.1 Zn-dependent hydrolase, glyoxylase [Corynebacterium epidermidicanis]
MELMGFASGPYQTNCYVLADNGACVVIDPGMNTVHPLLTMFEDKQLRLESIVLTHGHIDHTRDAGELAQRFGVNVYIHPADEFMLSDGKGVSLQTQELFDAKNMTAIPNPQHLNHGETVTLLGVEFEIRHAPGHSPGCVLLVAPTLQLCFSGDVLFKGSIGRTDLADSNHDDMLESLRSQVLTLPDELAVLPGHGPDTTIRAERMTNPFLQSLR